MCVRGEEREILFFIESCIMRGYLELKKCNAKRKSKSKSKKNRQEGYVQQDIRRVLFQ